MVEHGTTQSGSMVHIVFDAPATGSPGVIRVKIEINVAETESFLPRETRSYEVQSRWWSGQADVSTFQMEELMSTKLGRCTSSARAATSTTSGRSSRGCIPTSS